MRGQASKAIRDRRIGHWCHVYGTAKPFDGERAEVYNTSFGDYRCFARLFLSRAFCWRSVELRDLYMRSPILWLAFWLLLAFWFAAFYFHLRGGVTTYSLVVVGIALLLKRGRVSAR